MIQIGERQRIGKTNGLMLLKAMKVIIGILNNLKNKEYAYL